jgi:hypothetical protein
MFLDVNVEQTFTSQSFKILQNESFSGEKRKKSVEFLQQYVSSRLTFEYNVP